MTTLGGRYITMREQMLFTASGLLATMGNGVPYAVAAAAAFRGGRWWRWSATAALP